MPASRRAPRGDGDATRLKVLNAAGKLIALNGFAATSSKVISETAGVDLASINYHFGGRSGLYEAVLIEGHGRLISLEALEVLARDSISPIKKLEILIDSLVMQIYSEDDWPVRVVARELLSPTAHVKALLAEGVMPKFLLVRSILGQILKVDNEDHTLVRCMVSVMAPCLMLLVMSHAAPEPVRDVVSKSSGELANHLKRFARGGLQSVRRHLANS
ncbi:TetR/AcrR family transcriptional regulator [Pseudomonas sp.]|uniref:TetR/AcrR family transcriptional regulator n=1 Tax=Pseudomonas sp. TaxID=306 RepID=UPI0028B01F1C|nr:TetR/AcrR family transcriptional regulator [Pseudomonas sp.]